MTGVRDDEPDSGYPRLESQIKWYDRRSAQAQSRYKWVKITEVGCAALVPLISQVNGIATAALGFAIIVFEAIQHLNQWQHNWITYRSTCEALRHEKYTFLARSGPYEGIDNDATHKLLVERVEGLISTEHSKWITNQESTTRRMEGTKG